jgi:putative ABC transport system permease protein
MYRPYAQWPVNSMYVLVRSKLAPGTLVPALRSAVWKVDPSIPISELRSGEELIRASVTDERMTSFVVVTFAALALILALVGIYGVIGYSVEQRTHEIAIRMALGAQRQHIFQQVVGEGLGMALVGLVFGLAAALACTRLLVGRLYQTTTGDVPTYMVVAVLMAIAALVSSGVPAWRATQVDQISALKHE